MKRALSLAIARRALGLLALGALPLAGLSQGAVAAPNELLQSWFAAQTNLQSWSAEFLQTRSFKSLSQPLTAQGRVWFSAPNRFRWELGDPPKTIAVRGAREMLVIYPRLKRAERYNLDNAGPWKEALALLETGFPRSETEMRSRFNILSQSLTNQTCELILQPKSAAARKMMPRIQLAFSTTDFALRATELQFADGSSMRNEFSKALLNPAIEEQFFAPKLDPDFKVVEPLKHQ
jgi:outer membrane lipoprotein-sorting protein